MKFTIEKKSAIFKKLVSETLYETGVSFGLDKHYSTPQSVKTKVYTIYNEVKNDPEKFGIQPDTLDLVVDTVSNRKIAKTKEPTIAEQEGIKVSDVKSLTLGGRDKLAGLINKKLVYLETHPKALKEESLVNLAKVYSTMFDKAQIIQGQATDHVAIMGKIDAVLKMRELQQAEKGDR